MIVLQGFLEVSRRFCRNPFACFGNPQQFLFPFGIGFKIFGDDSGQAGISLGEHNSGFKSDDHCLPVDDLLIQGQQVGAGNALGLFFGFFDIFIDFGDNILECPLAGHKIFVILSRVAADEAAPGNGAGLEFGDIFRIRHADQLIHGVAFLIPELPHLMDFFNDSSRGSGRISG